MHSDAYLYGQLINTLNDIGKQIDDVNAYAQALIDQFHPEGTTVYQIRDKNGKPVLTELLAAKATCLSAMVALKGMKK